MKDPTRAPFYACLYHGLCGIARERGYALAIHGSVATDLDIVAIPWTEEAVDPEVLKDALMAHIGACDYRGRIRRDCGWASEEQIDQIVKSQNDRHGKDSDADFSKKPHGRMAWNLYLDAGCKVDLSIMPRKELDKSESMKQEGA